MIQKKYKNINGEVIEVNINEEGFYKRITIDSPKLNFRKWFLWSLFFYLIGSYFHLHYQEVKVMIFVIFILLVLLLLKINSKIQQESLLIVASVGVQLTTRFMSGRTLCIFYNANDVKDVIINEAICMHRVVCYLCLMLHKYPSMKLHKLVPLFTFTWPSLPCLKVIRKETKLYLAPNYSAHNDKDSS